MDMSDLSLVAALTGKSGGRVAVETVNVYTKASEGGATLTGRAPRGESVKDGAEISGGGYGWANGEEFNAQRGENERDTLLKECENLQLAESQTEAEADDTYVVESEEENEDETEDEGENDKGDYEEDLTDEDVAMLDLPEAKRQIIDSRKSILNPCTTGKGRNKGKARRRNPTAVKDVNYRKLAQMTWQLRVNQQRMRLRQLAEKFHRGGQERYEQDAEEGRVGLQDQDGDVHMF